ncbi:hypothetical protein CKAH01_06655 [Colletotrichum kahawae]|uniref:Uncharacterized protein n=1 Tax=Colletotrichum kahawae TaxID=34407 RepID=A0AAD9Y7W1_COLKA|nr:hypothetical protein CKAH01_06655 [Colletotrichum kahawae]
MVAEVPACAALQAQWFSVVWCVWVGMLAVPARACEQCFFAGIPSFFFPCCLVAWVSSGQLPSRMETKRRPSMTGRAETPSRIRTRVDNAFFFQRRPSLTLSLSLSHTRSTPTEINDEEHMVGGCRNVERSLNPACSICVQTCHHRLPYSYIHN